MNKIGLRVGGIGRKIETLPWYYIFNEHTEKFHLKVNLILM